MRAFPSDPQQSRRIVMALALSRFADAVGNGMMLIILPLYVEEVVQPGLQLPQSAVIGLLIAVSGIANSLLQPVIGILTDRYPRRKLFILIGIALAGVSMLSLAVASGFTDLLLLRIAQGISVAITIPASLAIIVTITPQKQRGITMGSFNTMNVLGVTVGPVFGSILQSKFGFLAIFLVAGILILVSALPVHLWVLETPKEKADKGEKESVVQIPRANSGTFVLGIVMFVMASAFTMIAALQNEINVRLNQNAVAFAWAFSALSITRLLIQIPFGRLADRFGRKLPIVWGLILMTVTTALMAQTSSTAELALLRVGQGLATAAIAIPTFALAADLAKFGGEARQMSVIATGYGLGAAVGPFLAGFLAVFHFGLPFYLLAALSLINAGLVFLIVPETIRSVGERVRTPVERDNPRLQ